MVAWILNYDNHNYFHPSNIKIDLSYHPFIKYDIFEVAVTFPPIGTPIGNIALYGDHRNMYYISQATNNIPCNRAFTKINRTNVWILSVGRKKPTTVKQVLESILSKNITGKFNRVHIITYRRDKNIFRTNLQQIIYIFNRIRNIQSMEYFVSVSIKELKNGALNVVYFAIFL